MTEDFNLIVSCARGLESEACSEIWFLLGEVGDEDPRVEKTEVSGLVVAKTSLDPFEAIRRLREMLRREPHEFRYTLKVIPVETVVPTRLNSIEEAAAHLSEKISADESFRITIEKRHTEISTKEMIEAIARHIDRRVDLENPDRIVLVEILGKVTGISVIRPDDILSIAKEKRLLPRSEKG